MRTSAIVLSCLLLLGAAWGGERRDALNDWTGSGVQPEEGWCFLQYDPATRVYTPMVWGKTPSGDEAWLGSTPWCVIMEYGMCPQAYDAVRAWTAPESGTVRIGSHGTVRKMGEPGGDGLVIRIYRNGLLFFERPLAADDLTGWRLRTKIDVNKGDTLYFHANAGGATGWDGVHFLPTLKFKPGKGYDSVEPRNGQLLLNQSWQAPVDGEALVTASSPIRLRSASNEAVTLSLLRNKDVVRTIVLNAGDTKGFGLKRPVVMRKGDELRWHVDEGCQADVICSADVALYPNGAPPMPVIELDGDVNITEPTEWRYGHYKIRGNLRIEEGGVLYTECAVIELMCSYAREFSVYWEGGDMVSHDTTIGGTVRDGICYPCNLWINDGHWYSTDTLVRNIYGHVFSGQDNKKGYLYGLRHNNGPHSDSVIMGGNGQVTLKDSTYKISLNMNADGPAATTDLTLPLNTPMNVVFDKNNVAGVNYRLELDNTKVPFWWVFAHGISMDGEPHEIILRDVPKVCANIGGFDLTGSIQLPCEQGGGGPMPPNTSLTLGNLTYRTLDKPAGITGWGAYLNGPDTDLTLRGPTMVVEYMVFNGKSALIGDEGTYNAKCSATTVEVGNWWDKKTSVEVLFRNATVGTPKGWGVNGQITAKGKSRVVIENSKIINTLVLITEDEGTIVVRDCELDGRIRALEHGGKIIIENTRTLAFP